MNITAARAGLTPQIWDDRFFTEYVRKNQFARYMGTSISSMIQVKEDLTRKAGDRVTFAAVRRLVGAGVTGNQILEGNEELLNARSMTLPVSVIRHAVAVSDWDEQKSVIDLRDAARDALMVWELEKMRADIITAFSNITADGNVSVPFAAATAGQRNTWSVNNQDRILYGSSKSNYSGVVSTDLAKITNTYPASGTAGGKMNAYLLSLAKRLAKNANPRIRPITVNDDEEWYTVFLNSDQFRDFRNDPVVMQANRDAMERGKDNPLFRGGDLLWDQMIVREIPELGKLAGAGAAGIDVAPGFLCGAQALGVAWAQRMKSTTNTRDYGFMHGVGIQEMRGIDKLRFGRDPVNDTTAPVDAGIFTIFAASVADA
jgi:N4-gp56 family major capsid protein